jgi:hypothetical protein
MLPIFVIQASMRYQDATIAAPPDVAECLDHEMQKDFSNVQNIQKDNTCLVMCKKNPGRILVYNVPKSQQQQDLIVLGNMTSVDAEMLPSLAEYAAHIKSPFHEFLTVCIKHDLSLVKYLTPRHTAGFGNPSAKTVVADRNTDIGTEV